MSGDSVEATVEFDCSAARQQADNMVQDAGRPHYGPSELAFLRLACGQVKAQAMFGLAGVAILRDFENLTSMHVRFDLVSAYDTLLADSAVEAIHAIQSYELTLEETLPFINQPQVASAGIGGQGTTIAVLDTGVAYTWEPFSCVAPGPQCQIVAIRESAPDDSDAADGCGHGTNVSAIAASVAPDAKLIVADVANGDCGSIDDPSVKDAINWVIENQAGLNVVAMNLSFGFPRDWHTTHCPTASLAADLDLALAYGIQSASSSGNTAYDPLTNVFKDGIGRPSCIPGVISVGAVIDSDGGAAGGCASPTVSDQVACFSQTAPILSILAPGIEVTAGASPYDPSYPQATITMSGTSQASAHVSGAWAVMRSAMPNASAAEVLAELQATGVPVTDPRVTGRETPRLDLLAALDSDEGVGDGILFPYDNCVEVKTSDDTDDDLDGFGDRCDGDYDQSGVTTIVDFNIFQACFTKSVDPTNAPEEPALTHDPTCAESDMDGSTIVTISDFILFKSELGTRPGPSGLACADDSRTHCAVRPVAGA